MLDNQPPGPDFTFKLPFDIRTTRPPEQELAEIRGNQIIFKRALTGEDQVAVPIQGFRNDAADSEIVIENKTVGAGVRITGDRPLNWACMYSTGRARYYTSAIRSATTTQFIGICGPTRAQIRMHLLLSSATLASL